MTDLVVHGAAITTLDPGRPTATALAVRNGRFFAVGDVRRGSIKRVASAVGEGSVVISAVHQHLGPHVGG